MTDRAHFTPGMLRRLRLSAGYSDQTLAAETGIELHRLRIAESIAGVLNVDEARLVANWLGYTLNALWLSPHASLPSQNTKLARDVQSNHLARIEKLYEKIPPGPNVDVHLFQLRNRRVGARITYTHPKGNRPITLRLEDAALPLLLITIGKVMESVWQAGRQPPAMLPPTPKTQADATDEIVPSAQPSDPSAAQ